MKAKYFFIACLFFLSSCDQKSQLDFANSDSLLLSPTFVSISTCKDIVGNGPKSKVLEDSHIAFRGIDQQDGIQIWVLSFSDGELRHLKNYPPAPAGVKFLQDGKRFLIMGHSDLWIGDVGGSPPSQTEIDTTLLDNFQPYSLVWSDLISSYQPDPSEEIFDYYLGRFHSPDNNKIVSWKTGDQSLVLIDSNTNEEKQIIATGVLDTINGVWTKDSDRFIFAFTHDFEESFYGQLLQIASSNGEISFLTQQFMDTSFANPVLSPDEKKLAFIGSKGVDQAVGILWLDTNTVKFFKINT